MSIHVSEHLWIWINGLKVINLEGFDVHAVEHFRVFVAADVDDDVVVVLVRVDGVQEE